MWTSKHTVALTFTSLTGESIIVVPRRFVSAHHAQFFPFDPSCLGHVPGPFAHSGRRGTYVLHLSVIADLQGRFPQFICPSVSEPLVSTVRRVVVVVGVVWCGRHRWIHGRVLHAGIAGEGQDVRILQQRTALICQDVWKRNEVWGLRTSLILYCHVYVSTKGQFKMTPANVLVNVIEPLNHFPTHAVVRELRNSYVVSWQNDHEQHR